MSDTVVTKNGPVTEPEKAKLAREQAQPQRRATFTPRVDILEMPEELVLYLDLPGVRAEDVEIDFQRGELTVRARRESPPRKGQWLVEEYEVGDFSRSFLISQDLAADRIHAELKGGVLTVHLPRADAAQPRRISVKGT